MSKGISTTKISVKIFRPIIEQLIRRLDAACLRRDAYLNFLLGVELAALDKEVSVANTAASERLVSNRLAQLDTKLVSLALHTELVEQLSLQTVQNRVARYLYFVAREEGTPSGSATGTRPAGAGRKSIAVACRHRM